MHVLLDFSLVQGNKMAFIWISVHPGVQAYTRDDAQNTRQYTQ